MKKRIELHCESSYSYKNMGSVITPEELLNKCKSEKINAIGIVDTCTCAIIPELEKCKKRLGLDELKIVYGISLNIKYDDLYVRSILMARNSKGLKNLYKIVTKLNEDDCYFILQRELDKYKDDLILGISKFDLDKDYKSVISYYDYVEVTPMMNQEDVIKINKYCKNNNLLLIATSRPTRLDKNNLTMTNIVKELYDTFAPTTDANYYWDTDSMLDAFDYLENRKEVIIDNPYKIIEKIEDYNLSFDKKYMIQPEIKGTLRKECLERVNLIYLDEVPKNVMERLNDELNKIEELDLEGTILLIKDIIDEIKRLGSYGMVDSFFSHSLVAYLLGLTPINPMNLKKKINIFNEYERYGLLFDIIIPKYIQSRIKEYLRMILKNSSLYCKSTLYGIGHSSNFIDYLKEKDMSDLEKEYLITTMKDVKVHLSTPLNIYYLIPEDLNMLELTPINYKYDSKILEFSDDFRKSFVSARFRITSYADTVNTFEKNTKVRVEEIPLDDKEIIIKTFNNLYEENDRITKKIIPQSLEEIIDLECDTDSRWLSFVMYKYYVNYYMTYFNNNLEKDIND